MASREFVSITVPVERVDEVYDLLARRVTAGPARSVTTGPPATDTAANDESLIVRAYRLTSDTMRQVLDLLSENPGRFITGLEIENQLGIKPPQFRGHLGGFTRLWYGPLGQPDKTPWFFEAEQTPGGTYQYRASQEVAAEIRRAKEEYVKSKER